MSGNFHSLLNNDHAAPQVETPPSPIKPVVAASDTFEVMQPTSIGSVHPIFKNKRGRPRIYPDAKTRRREYMREYRARIKVTKGQS